MTPTPRPWNVFEVKVAPAPAPGAEPVWAETFLYETQAGIATARFDAACDARAAGLTGPIVMQAKLVGGTGVRGSTNGGGL